MKKTSQTLARRQRDDETHDKVLAFRGTGARASDLRDRLVGRRALEPNKRRKWSTVSLMPSEFEGPRYRANNDDGGSDEYSREPGVRLRSFWRCVAGMSV
jgi:hypothetical protein